MVYKGLREFYINLLFSPLRSSHVSSPLCWRKEPGLWCLSNLLTLPPPPCLSWGCLLLASENLKFPTVLQHFVFRQCTSNFCGRLCFPLIHSGQGWPLHLLVNRNVNAMLQLSASLLPKCSTLVAYSLWFLHFFDSSVEPELTLSASTNTWSWITSLICPNKGQGLSLCAHRADGQQFHPWFCIYNL